MGMVDMDQIDTLFARTFWLSHPNLAYPTFLERRAPTQRERADRRGDLRGLSLVTAGPEPVRATVASSADQLAAAAQLVEQSAVRTALGSDLAALQRLAAVDARVDDADTTGFAAPAWMELGTALFRIRKYDRAAAVMLEILRHDPTDAAALALVCEMQVRAKLRIVPTPLVPRAAPGVRDEVSLR